jgi:acyl-CoA thioesterase I
MAAGQRVILVLGDSLSAGYGIDVSKGWVALLQQRLQREGYPYQVVNASISGDTTRGALARLGPLIEAHHPAIVVVELGGNDGLRGLSLAELRHNLKAIVARCRAANAQVLLVKMRLPPNYGPAYTERFEQIYTQLAREHGVRLAHFILDGVATHPELMQADGIHARAAGQPRMLENIWPELLPLLKKD